MNKDALKKMSWKQVRLRPLPRRFHHLSGVELPPVDDAWLIGLVTNAGIPISLDVTGHGTTLKFDHVHNFTSGLESEPGFLNLSVQISLCGDNLRIEPLSRPGEGLGAAVSRIQGWERRLDEGFLAGRIKRA